MSCCGTTSCSKSDTNQSQIVSKVAKKTKTQKKEKRGVVVLNKQDLSLEVLKLHLNSEDLKFLEQQLQLHTQLSTQSTEQKHYISNIAMQIDLLENYIKQALQMKIDIENGTNNPEETGISLDEIQAALDHLYEQEKTLVKQKEQTTAKLEETRKHIQKIEQNIVGQKQTIERAAMQKVSDEEELIAVCSSTPVVYPTEDTVDGDTTDKIQQKFEDYLLRPAKAAAAA